MLTFGLSLPTKTSSDEGALSGACQFSTTLGAITPNDKPTANVLPTSARFMFAGLKLANVCPGLSSLHSAADLRPLYSTV